MAVTSLFREASIASLAFSCFFLAVGVATLSLWMTFPLNSPVYAIPYSCLTIVPAVLHMGVSSAAIRAQRNSSSRNTGPARPTCLFVWSIISVCLLFLCFVPLMVMTIIGTTTEKCRVEEVCWFNGYPFDDNNNMIAGMDECCWRSDLGNGECDLNCNQTRTNFDEGDCLFCGDCPRPYIGDGVCNPVCYNAQCDQDGGDCDDDSNIGNRHLQQLGGLPLSPWQQLRHFPRATLAQKLETAWEAAEALRYPPGPAPRVSPLRDAPREEEEPGRALFLMTPEFNVSGASNASFFCEDLLAYDQTAAATSTHFAWGCCVTPAYALVVRALVPLMWLGALLCFVLLAVGALQAVGVRRRGGHLPSGYGDGGGKRKRRRGWGAPQAEEKGAPQAEEERVRRCRPGGHRGRRFRGGGGGVPDGRAGRGAAGGGADIRRRAAGSGRGG